MAKLFGAKLRYLRLQHELTQLDLAERLSVAGQTYVSNLEAGRKVPSLDLILRVAAYFHVTTDFLLRDAIAVEETKEVTGLPATHSSTMSRFGTKLHALRTHGNLSQRDLARRLGLTSRAYISNLEAGRKLPSLDLVVQLADMFGVTTDYLLRDNIQEEANDTIVAQPTV